VVVLIVMFCAWGILSVFALTGFMGFTLGPMVGAYWTAAPAVVMQALAGLGAVFFQMPALSLAVSAMFVLLMSGLILFETSRIVNGGETYHSFFR